MVPATQVSETMRESMSRRSARLWPTGGAGAGEVGKRGLPTAGPIRKIKLGRYPALGLHAARKMVEANAEKLETGVDPRAAEREATLEELSDARTFEAVAERALADDDNTQRHRDVRDHLLPLIGKRPINGITRRDLAVVRQAYHERSSCR